MTEIVSSGEFNQLMSLVSGADGVDALVAMFGFFVLYYGKKISKGLSAKVEDLIENITTGDEKTMSIENKIEISTRMKKAVMSYFDKTRAYKTMIFQFHNGSKLLNGVHFLKCSCTHEFINSCVEGKKEVSQTNYLGIPLTFFTYYLSQLKRKTMLFIPDIEEIKSQDYGAYLRLQKLGAKGLVLAGLYKDEMLVGCVSCLFKEMNEDSIPSIRKHTKALATKVNGILIKNEDDPHTDE